MLSPPPALQISSHSQADLQTEPMAPTRPVPVTIEREIKPCIYSKTHGKMVVRTANVFAHASRNFQRRQYTPMKRPRTAFHKRRYSIDVNSGVEERKVQRTRDCRLMQLEDEVIQVSIPTVSRPTGSAIA
ncbi:hypothetical protein OPT61_g1739 [Boeremia exigua]|uniref:Uncharacterized protein n=1 Tax=Boeremia exigua TaxID=749465 RepID=A0ACC2IP99_9PLEO|nr:hypothetical protein OPT61_g1739 [Boeremia exigua]